MKNVMYYTAALASSEVYKKNHDLGTTEFDIFTTFIDDKKTQVLAIAGTNEDRDWMKNINPMSKKGIKKVAYEAAEEIFESDYFNDKRIGRLPLIVTGHSKAGATAIAFHILSRTRVFGSQHCVAFAPARSLRYWINRKMEDTTIFIDPNDPVSFFGRLGFGHPICEHIKAPNDHFGFKIKDHDISNWVAFCYRACLEDE